jgi:hypothetical protein
MIRLSTGLALSRSTIAGRISCAHGGLGRSELRQHSVARPAIFRVDQLPPVRLPDECLLLAKSGGPASVPDTTAASRKPAVRTAYVRIPSVSAASLSAADATVRGQKRRELTQSGPPHISHLSMPKDRLN